jgi:acetyl esterase/lipase
MKTSSQAERDAAYNNAAAVTDSAALNAARRAGSAQYRKNHPQHLDIPYGTGAREAWDFYVGEEPGAACLIFIHGGYWFMNGREDFAALAAGVAAHGWHVAMPGYSLAPEISVSGIVGQIRAALDWFAAHRAEHGITGRVVLSGWSAGAQLAAMTLDHPVADAGLLVSGVYELGPLAETYLNEKLHLSAADIETCSPLRLAPVNKPAVIAYGAQELPALVHDSEALHARRVEAGCQSEILALEGRNHFTILRDLISLDGALVKAALELV